MIYVLGVAQVVTKVEPATPVCQSDRFQINVRKTALAL